jgi:hypothetical protein
VQKFCFVSCATLIFRQIAYQSIFQLFFRCRLPLRTRPIHQFSDGVVKLKAEKALHDDTRHRPDFSEMAKIAPVRIISAYLTVTTDSLQLRSSREILSKS